MKQAIHNISPKTGPTDQQWADLEGRVDKLTNTMSKLTPENVGKAVATALRPLAAEQALRAQELKNSGNKVSRAGFKAPSGSDDDIGSISAGVKVGNFRVPEGE